MKIVFSKEDVKVYYHGEDDFLSFSGRMGHKIKKGKKVQTQVRIQDIMQLSRYIHDSHEGHGGHQISCKDHKYDNCMYHALEGIMKTETEDNCTVPWIRNNDNICTKQKDMQTAFWIHWNRSLNQKRDCDIACRKMFVDVHGKNFEESNDTSNYGQLFTYFSLDVAKGEERHLYSAYSLVAEVYIYIFRIYIIVIIYVV